jgi:hypothetical protein
MGEQRLRDIVKFGMSPDEIAGQLRAIGTAISALAEWIKKNRPRDERNLILFNLLAAPLPYINCAQNPSGALPALVFCTRATFELNAQAAGTQTVTDDRVVSAGWTSPQRKVRRD